MTSDVSPNTQRLVKWARRQQLGPLISQTPIPDDHLANNLAVYLSTYPLAQVLFLNHVYQKVAHHPGACLEFGVRYGRNLSTLQSLRALHEPLNANRRIVGFDTFTGFPEVSEEDEADRGFQISEGFLAVPDNYDEYLQNLLKVQAAQINGPDAPPAELIRGDVCETVPGFFEASPETIVALAIFDLDLYKPTLACLHAVAPFLTKGSILVFDQISDPEWPGETLAIREALDLRDIRIERLPFSPHACYVEV